MPSRNKQPQIPLPRSWDTRVKTATILHVVALARYALGYSRSWAADSTDQRIRLKAGNDRFQRELACVKKSFESRTPGSARWLQPGGLTIRLPSEWPHSSLIARVVKAIVYGHRPRHYSARTCRLCALCHSCGERTGSRSADVHAVCSHGSAAILGTCRSSEIFDRTR